jgi:hypothetical protein
LTHGGKNLLCNALENCHYLISISSRIKKSNTSKR